MRRRVGTQWPDLWPFVLHTHGREKACPAAACTTVQQRAHNCKRLLPVMHRQLSIVGASQNHARCSHRLGRRFMVCLPYHFLSTTGRLFGILVAGALASSGLPPVAGSCFAALRRGERPSGTAPAARPAFESMPFQGTMPATRLTVRVWRASRAGVCPRCRQNNFKAKWLRFPPRPAALPAARHCSPSYAQDKGGFVSRWRRPMPSRSNMANARSIS